MIMANEVVLCKNNEIKKKICVNFPQPSDFARRPDLIV